MHYPNEKAQNLITARRIPVRFRSPFITQYEHSVILAGYSPTFLLMGRNERPRYLQQLQVWVTLQKFKSQCGKPPVVNKRPKPNRHRNYTIKFSQQRYVQKEPKKVTSVINKATSTATWSIYSCAGKQALLWAEFMLLMNMVDPPQKNPTHPTVSKGCNSWSYKGCETHPEEHCNSWKPLTKTAHYYER